MQESKKKLQRFPPKTFFPKKGANLVLYGLMGGYLFSVSGTLVSLCNLSFSRMRKLNRLLTLVLLLVCAISMKEIVHGTGFLCSISNSPDNIVPEQIAHGVSMADVSGGISNHNANTVVGRSRTSQNHFLDPCAGNLYPTPEEGKLVRAKVSGTEFDMFIYDHDSVKDIVSGSIKASGSWEMRDTQVLMNLMRCDSSQCENRVFMDVGANIGWYSLTAVNLGFSVLSFEPFRSNLGLICSSMQKLDESIAKRLKVFDVGLDFKPRHCELFQQRSVNVGDTHSVCDGTSRGQFIEKGYAPLGWMNTTTLDLALEAGYFGHVDHVDVMKVDVEGFEYSVMEGGNQFFQSSFAPKYIFMELLSSLMGDAGGLSDRGESRLESVLMKLTNYGYELDQFSNTAAGDGLSLRASPIHEVRKFADGKNVLFKKII